MIKSSIMFSAHAIRTFLRNTLIALVLLAIALFIWLLVGIQVNGLKVGDYSIGRLYIKLDKKLTLNAENIVLHQSKERPSFDNVDKVFDQIKYLFTYFESIDLKNITFDNNQFDFIFVDDILYITSKDYEIAGNIHRIGQVLTADISMLYIKRDNVHMYGKLTYDLDTERLTTEGKFNGYEITGDFTASKLGDIIDFNVKSNTFSTLHPLLHFEFNEGIKSWILDKVEAEKYTLLALSGQGKIDQGALDLDVKTLKGEMLFSKVKIHFKEDLPPVLASSFMLRFKDEGLYFDLKEPTYEGLDLNGSEVSILNLLNEKTNLKIKIKADSAFDKRLNKLLKAYDIALPIGEKSAEVNVLFMADIGLKNDYKDFFVGVNFAQGDVWLNKIKLPVQKGNLQYRGGIITLNDIVLKDAQFGGKVDGTIDLEKQTAALVFDAKYIKMKSKKETLFTLKNKTLPFTVEYKDKTKIHVPKLSLTVVNDHNKTAIKISDLKKIKPYLSDASLLEEGGHIHISTKDFKRYTFNGTLKRSSCFLYVKEKQCEVNVPFSGKVTEKDVDFFAFNKAFHFIRSKSRITLNKLHIDLEKFLESKKVKSKKVKSRKSKQGKPLTILGKHSHLKYGNYRLLMDSYDVEVKANGNIKAIGSASGDIIKFSMKNNHIAIDAYRIKDKILHPMLNFNGLYNGRYSLKIAGDPEKQMKGHVIVEGGVMKGFEAYNNTLAFINTLPALAVLQNPGYSTKGFSIEEGIAEYRQIARDKIIFDSIYIKSSSATIVGKGELNLKKRSIHMNLAIQVARELGKVVGSVPLLGYILMGENKSITVGLKITGKIDNPIVTTSGTKDMLLLPLDILKRTLESPAHILNH